MSLLPMDLGVVFNELVVLRCRLRIALSLIRGKQKRPVPKERGVYSEGTKDDYDEDV